MFGCANNPENFSKIKIGEHIPCGFSVSTIWAFDKIQNKHTLYFGEDCMKKFCNSLREHATNVFNFEKNNMLPLTKQNLFIAQDLWQVHYQGRKKLGTIVILQVNIEAQHIVIVI